MKLKNASSFKNQVGPEVCSIWEIWAWFVSHWHSPRTEVQLLGFSCSSNCYSQQKYMTWASSTFYAPFTQPTFPWVGTGISWVPYHIMAVHVEICPFLSPLSSGSLIKVSALHHHETEIIGWVINHSLLWELWSVYLNAQESHLIVDIFVHMLTARDNPVIPAAPCLRLPKPYIIAFTLSQETLNASLSGQQYKSG